MNIAFYIDEMNFRGVSNSTYIYAKYNQSILKNKSYIFFNNKNYRNQKKVIKTFKRFFTVNGVSNFVEIENYKERLKLDFIYTQKSGNKDNWFSDKIKTIVHALYPQRLSSVHGYNYTFVSNWVSKNFSNNKIPYLPYIVEIEQTKKDLRKVLNISRKELVLGCLGGESSFDLKFAQHALVDFVNEKKNITFLFLNINKFIKHRKIKFLKGTFDSTYKKKFLNTCDAMIYGRSLGETFGLSCGEFSLLKKPIISYRFNRHRAHIDHCSKSGYLEYSSKNGLLDILNNFQKNSKALSNKKNDYQDFKPKKVMKIFNDLLHRKKKVINYNFYDYLLNYYSFLKMTYYYLRHKIYNHYYNLLEQNLFRKNSRKNS